MRASVQVAKTEVDNALCLRVCFHCLRAPRTYLCEPFARAGPSFACTALFPRACTFYVLRWLLSLYVRKYSHYTTTPLLSFFCPTSNLCPLPG